MSKTYEDASGMREYPYILSGHLYTSRFAILGDQIVLRLRVFGVFDHEIDDYRYEFKWGTISEDGFIGGHVGNLPLPAVAPCRRTEKRSRPAEDGSFTFLTTMITSEDRPYNPKGLRPGS